MNKIIFSKSINQVSSYKILISTNDLIYRLRTKELVINSNKFIETPINEFWVYNHFILLNQLNNASLYKLENASLDLVKEFNNFQFINSKGIGIFLTDLNDESKIFQLCLDRIKLKPCNLKYCWENLYLAENDYLYLQNDNYIIKHSLKSGNSMLLFEVKKLGSGQINLYDERIKKILGVSNKSLIVLLSSSLIISIDVNSGKLLWELSDWEKDFIFFNEKHKWYNATHNMFIEDGKIYNMSGALYYSIDLETRAVDILWHDERPVDHYFVKYFTYDRDYIYFAGGINISIQANKIGVFNRKTLQVECISDDDLGIDPLHGYAASYNQAPQYGGGKLYGLDTAGNLRIYQVDLS